MSDSTQWVPAMGPFRVRPSRVSLDGWWPQGFAREVELSLGRHAVAIRTKPGVVLLSGREIELSKALRLPSRPCVRVDGALR